MVADKGTLGFLSLRIISYYVGYTVFTILHKQAVDGVKAKIFLLD